LGTQDLVLVDNIALLKTAVRRDNCEMRSSILTLDTEQIQKAQAFFKRLLEWAHSTAASNQDKQRIKSLQDACFGPSVQDENKHIKN
jgi:hypothetical protein